MASHADAIALHARGPHILAAETEGAVAFARAIGLRLEIVDFDPLAVPEVATTSRLRCYGCKKALVAALRQRLRELGEEDRTLCDGSNADDLATWRPGLRALEEGHVLSPLAAAGLAKAEIRRLALAEGMPMPAHGPRPCLLTRYAYGLAPDREELARLADVEARLLALAGENGERPDFRVRLTPSPVLQVAGADDAWLEEAGAILAGGGFAPFRVLACEHVSGFYDAAPGGGPGSGKAAGKREGD